MNSPARPPERPSSPPLVRRKASGAQYAETLLLRRQDSIRSDGSFRASNGKGARTPETRPYIP
eukprot:8928181-Pyramimonas_sp.AAC.1